MIAVEGSEIKWMDCSLAPGMDQLGLSTSLFVFQKQMSSYKTEAKQPKLLRHNGGEAALSEVKRSCDIEEIEIVIASVGPVAADEKVRRKDSWRT